jgi:OOP family OmpA-OmpF porin
MVFEQTVSWRVNPRLRALILLMVCLGPARAFADPAWVLDPAASSLSYQSIKKNSIVETNSIRNITGRIEPDGAASIALDLNSVDTGVDLRNVRMRFLFFETFKYPTAMLTAQVDPADFADLPTRRRVVVPLDFRLSLHGVEKALKSEVVVTLITDGMVSVASKSPIAVQVEDFGLLPAIEKLEQAANVTNIVPTASVSFDFVFGKEGADAAPGVAANADAATPAEQPAATQVAAVPVTTDAAKSGFSAEECVNRFEVLSLTGAIYFREGSARLDKASRPALDAVVDVVGKCPQFKVEVAGHTDSDGSDEQNLALSMRRAAAVVDFVRAAGIPAERLSASGHGESRPVRPNDSEKNKGLNRRIEFSGTPLAN